jgi:hypothetical protein
VRAKVEVKAKVKVECFVMKLVGQVLADERFDDPVWGRESQ